MARRSNDDARGIDGGVRLPERHNHALPATLGGTKVDEEDLIVAVVDQFAEDVSAFREIDGSELTFEDGVLQVVPEITHGLVDFTKPLVVADVVADEVGGTH